MQKSLNLPQYKYTVFHSCMIQDRFPSDTLTKHVKIKGHSLPGAAVIAKTGLTSLFSALVAGASSLCLIAHTISSMYLLWLFPSMISFVSANL